MNNTQYYEHSVISSRKQNELRSLAWQDRKCQQIYHDLINEAGGLAVVRPGMKGEAKQTAITSFLRDEPPNTQKFIDRVAAANSFKR